MRKKYLVKLATGLLIFGIVGIANAATSYTWDTTNPLTPKLLSIKGIDVDGTFHDVTFIDGYWDNSWSTTEELGMNASNTIDALLSELENMQTDGIISYAGDLVGISATWANIYTGTGYGNGDPTYVDAYVGQWLQNPNQFNNLGFAATDVSYTLDTGSNDYSTWAVWEVSEVPIPAAVWLFGSGLIGLIGIARRKKA